MARNNEALAKRFARKAQSILNRRGSKLRFVGGTAIDSTANMGMQDLLRAEPNQKNRVLLAEAISECLNRVPRDWTVIYGFIHEQGEDSFVIEADSMVIHGADADGMATVANYTMAKEFRNEPVITRLGQVWMAIPAVLPDTYDEIEYITNIGQWMIDTGFFETEHMRNRLAAIAAFDVFAAEEALKELEEKEQA